MKRALLFCGVITLLLISFLLWQHRNRGTKPALNLTSAINGHTGEVSTSGSNQPSYLKQSARSFPDDPRPEVRQLYQFARAANLYNFDPTITAYEDILTPTVGRGPKRVTGKLIDTSTHTASMTGGILDKVVSARDCSNPLDPADEGPAMKVSSGIIVGRD